MISEFSTLRLGLFISVLGLMFFIETYWPTRSWFDRRAERVKFSAGLAIVNNVFMRLFIAAPFIALTNWVQHMNWGLSKVLGLNGLIEILTTLIIFDFLDALKHKWFHRVPFLWRFHRVHHTDRTLDILTALRYHPGELFISALIKGGWILLWGPSVISFTVFEIVLNFASEFHHSNIHLGRIDSYLNKIIVTPRYHAIHHTINREKGDQNFTTIFSFWDKILGTYACPETTAVNLERLKSLQNQHLSLINVLKSPLISPSNDGNERFNEDKFESHSDFVNNIYENAKRDILNSKALLVDVREESERSEYGVLHPSVSMPFNSLANTNLDQLIKMGFNKKIYVFCRAGVRAQKLIDRLNKQGIQAMSLGGYHDCVEHHLT